MYINNLATILMLKNENRYIYGENDIKPNKTMLEEQLDFLKFSEKVYILDGGSTDGSLDIYKKYDNTVVYNQNFPYNENKCLNFLLEKVKSNKHKYMLYLDGDEILEKSSIEYIIDFLSSNDKSEYFTIRFNYINLWRSRLKYRKDKWYNSESGKFFSVKPNLISYGTEFNNHYFVYGKNFDFGDIYYSGKRVIHYAWVDWNHILKKYNKCVENEIKYNKTSFKEASEMYKIILDESDIILEDVDKEWFNE